MARHERDDSAAGTTLTLAVGDELTLRLAEAPTTGYRWAVERLEESVLTLLRSEFHLRDAAPGGGGERWFTLGALRPGLTTVALKLWRAWAGEASVYRRFEITVVVIEG
jgi:inhibitor of cysteine peptidase